jgi:RmlD substrate binding domain.
VEAIVGYTGFVGSNICRKHSFGKYYNSKNIVEAYGLDPDELVYSGVRAEKYMANMCPDKDLEHINNAIENIKRINPKHIILISTIDVLSNLNYSNEKSAIDPNKLDAYGRNRFLLETWVREHFNRYLIVRLPAVFGEGIKKNFVYDIMNPIPKRLNKRLYLIFSEKFDLIKKLYKPNDNGIYVIEDDNEVNSTELKRVFKSLNFTSLNFTDSRCFFQFYPLRRLWNDISIAQNNNLTLVHLATEPVGASEIHERLYGTRFNNEICAADSVKRYNFITDYSYLFGGKDGYLICKEDILNEIQRFVGEYKL